MEELSSNQHYTAEDFVSWGEGIPCELIHGTVVTMAGATESHQDVVLEIATQLKVYLRGKQCKAYVAPYDVFLSEDTVVEPDVFIVCDPTKRTARGCKGAPDMVVEVVSPSSMRMDMYTKHNLYKQAGVREYWIAYPEMQIVNVYLLKDGKYEITSYGREDKLRVAVLEDCVIDLALVFP